MRFQSSMRMLSLALLAGVLLVPPPAVHADERLQVCTTTPDLGSLVREIGGDRVDVTVFVKGTEDPHFAEAKPSFVRALADADLFVLSGLDLETGYAPLLLQQARNAQIVPGARGYLDASTAAGRPLEIPTTVVDRSMGDVHPLGNPHYMLDPLRALAVARAITAKLGELAPASASYFDERLRAFQDELYRRMVGAELARRYGNDVPKLVLLYQNGKLASFLDGQGQRAELGGWLGRMLPHAGTKAVEDHKIWTYFANVFGLAIVADLEPLPGVPPTTKNLERVIELMRAQSVKLVLASAYYDPRYAQFVAEKTGARVLKMANQVGAVPGVDSYLDMISYNVDQVAPAPPAGS